MNYPKCSTARPRIGVQARLMTFLCCMTSLILLLVYLLTTNFLQPRYNRYMRTRLTQQMDILVNMIDSCDEPISVRDLWSVRLNTAFWSDVNTAINDGTLDVSNCCVDVVDLTLNSVNYIENVHPCLIHGSSYSMGVTSTVERNTKKALQLRTKLFQQGELYETFSTDSSSSQMVVGRLSADGQYGVIFSANLAQVGVASLVLRQMFPLVFGLVLLFSLITSYFFSLWFTRPITRLSKASREIARGNYQVRVPVDTTTELGLLAEDFNHMADRVQRASQMQKDLLANVSHDLRTPLTLVKGYAETIRDITGDDKARRTEQLDIIVDETDRLAALVNSVMELSKVSSGAQPPVPVAFDMSDLCFEVAGRYEALCAQNGWQLRLEAASPCPVWADPAMMERVLHNLLGNATHHLGSDGVFVLRAIPRASGGCRVEVEDHGPGIPAEDLPYIFDRYYRSRSNSGKTGTGLGLSITKAILQGHGFAFGVDSTPGQGSLFWFEMSAPTGLPQ